MIDMNDPELIHATLENIRWTQMVYKQREREYRLAAKADRGVFYTDDKDRFIREANKYKSYTDELNVIKSAIIDDIRIIMKTQK